MNQSLQRFDNLKECVKIVLKATENLSVLMKEETNRKRRNELSELILNLARANQGLAHFLKEKLPDYCKSDEIDIKFNQIMKDLKNGS